MLQVISVKCPQCCADIDIDEGMKTCFCKYCGSKLVIADGSTPSIHQMDDKAGIIEAEVIEQADDDDISDDTIGGNRDSDILAVYDELIKSGSDTDELYVLGDMNVGANKDLKPGIYDMSFIGGAQGGYLDHSEFGQGQYLVGRDIEEGNYLVGLNGSLGEWGTWFIEICSLDEDGTYYMKITQHYKAGNTDIAIFLHESDVLSLSANKCECTGNLVLTKFN